MRNGTLLLAASLLAAGIPLRGPGASAPVVQDTFVAERVSQARSCFALGGEADVLGASRFAAAAEVASTEWTTNILSPAFWPPSLASYVFLPGEPSGGCDRLCMRYEADKAMITLSHTADLIAVQIYRRHWEEQAPLSLQTVEHEAKALFAQTYRVPLTYIPSTVEEQFASLSQVAFAPNTNITIVASTEGGQEGRVLGSAPWLRECVWCQNGPQLTFVLLIEDGELHAGFTSYHATANRTWFSEILRATERSPRSSSPKKPPTSTKGD